MSTRVSRSLLDPVVGPRLSAIYPHLHIPAWFPPEGIVAAGHLSAIAGAVGFAFSGTTAWGGLLAACGIAGNHFADCIDGRHARATGQCRNGGELLDHFTDPLSFTYWMIGLAVAADCLELGIVAATIVMAMAVLTNLRAKLTGEFSLSAFGPTEFKALLIVISCVFAFPIVSGTGMPLIALAGLCGLGIIMLPIQLARSVVEVNRSGGEPDQSEWVLERVNSSAPVA